MMKLAGKYLFSLCAAVAVATAATIAGAQQPLAAPEGDVLLTVSGDIAVTNGDDVARFDRDMLQALSAATVTTGTIWTEGMVQFTGVRLKTLLDAVGVTDGTLDATAINDYAVEIPVSDAVEDGPIIAYEMNGAPMSVRDKGPLWIVYPYDDDPDYRTEVIYSRSIWQLDRIIVRD